MRFDVTRFLMIKPSEKFFIRLFRSTFMLLKIFR